MKKQPKILISAGGTGGHIFPALAVANELKQINPNTEILFVGAKGKMEMEKVPQAGYEIIGLPVKGMPRKISLKFISFLFSLLKSWLQARKIVKKFKPDVAAGFGGYASGPVLHWAARFKIPTVIQEQNSFAGKTNKLLAKKAHKICVSYSGMEKFFPSSKIIFTGNPIRKQIFNSGKNRDEALQFFVLSEKLPVILILGGSLGARSINNQILNTLNWINTNNVQLLWQTGKLYFEEMVTKTNLFSDELSEENRDIFLSKIKIHRFIEQMDLAYLSADLIISRAGAATISELCVVGKPAILVPSPNVAEDHQTHNARSLSDKNAAILLPDNQLQTLPELLDKLLNQPELKSELAKNIKTLAITDADSRIANEILNTI